MHECKRVFPRKLGEISWKFRTLVGAVNKVMLRRVLSTSPNGKVIKVEVALLGTEN